MVVDYSLSHCEEYVKILKVASAWDQICEHVHFLTFGGAAKGKSETGNCGFEFNLVHNGLLFQTVCRKMLQTQILLGDNHNNVAHNSPTISANFSFVRAHASTLP